LQFRVTYNLKNYGGIAMTLPMTQQEKQAAYDAWFVAEVDKGLADIADGHVLTDAEATAEMGNFFAELAQENNKAA
jgi:hypothetical protein